MQSERSAHFSVAQSREMLERAFVLLRVCDFRKVNSIAIIKNEEDDGNEI